MFQSLLSAVMGRCPACHRGALNEALLKTNQTCPVCHVRFERFPGNWTISVVMSYGIGAVFAVLIGWGYYKSYGTLKGAENVILPVVMFFSLGIYPLCKNFTIGMLYINGFVYVDPPTLLKEPEQEQKP